MHPCNLIQCNASPVGVCGKPLVTGRAFTTFLPASATTLVRDTDHAHIFAQSFYRRGWSRIPIIRRSALFVASSHARFTEDPTLLLPHASLEDLHQEVAAWAADRDGAGWTLKNLASIGCRLTSVESESDTTSPLWQWTLDDFRILAVSAVLQLEQPLPPAVNPQLPRDVAALLWALKQLKLLQLPCTQLLTAIGTWGATLHNRWFEAFDPPLLLDTLQAINYLLVVHHSHLSSEENAAPANTAFPCKVPVAATTAYPTKQSAHVDFATGQSPKTQPPQSYPNPPAPSDLASPPVDLKPLDAFLIRLIEWSTLQVSQGRTRQDFYPCRLSAVALELDAVRTCLPCADVRAGVEKQVAAWARAVCRDVQWQLQTYPNAFTQSFSRVTHVTDLVITLPKLGTTQDEAASLMNSVAVSMVKRFQRNSHDMVLLSELTALIHAFADAPTASRVASLPLLLQAVSQKVMLDLVDEHEKRLALVAGSPAVPAPCSILAPQDILQLLQACCALHYNPGRWMLTVCCVELQCCLHRLSGHQLHQLTAVFEDLEFDPGPRFQSSLQQYTALYQLGPTVPTENSPHFQK